MVSLQQVFGDEQGVVERLSAVDASKAQLRAEAARLNERFVAARTRAANIGQSASAP